ncbi:RsmB/NOP family class I SAM-dependent RNA methyltransferase [Shewanella fodinae]|uniref:16S rRNA (Cytosine967-C5)-methyltransferase n=1 Tax=Shewanella fodinae TaxID=552357 RepID=A0A4R2F6H2_9GAMM|nr:RsmB/NOP family class I SAM-dependent RNA methyltransferase [Shewanella fodinae]TCN82307.1 16S rRNA (cytosine967-C5)-methyltransferase [Shewanella fodinae]
MSEYSLSIYACELAAQVIRDVISDGAPLDRAYSRQFAGLKLAPAQQAQITRVVGEIIRRLNFYCYLAHVSLADAGKHAADLLMAWHAYRQLPSPGWQQAKAIDAKTLALRLQHADSVAALRDGCPAWLDELGQRQLGDSWAAERAALAQAPKRYLRTNLLKCDRNQLQSRLAKEGISAGAVEGVATALEVTSDAALFRTDAFKDGWFEQQDAGSQHVADALDVTPGMRVIDACAGAGGKTLHLAAKMQGKGRLLAMDVEQWKLDNLKARARRAGAHNVETRLISSSKTIKRLKLSADRLLLDVPCSGLGVLKRNPDTKWRDTETRLPVLQALQAQILDSYSRMLKVDGILVYATCSIMPDENRQQVDNFLSNHANFRLLDDENISPARSGFDGFYLARLQRIAE